MEYKVAKANMSFIAQQGQMGMLDNIGVNKEDFDLITQPRTWFGTERNRVCQAFHNLLMGSISIAGVSPFELPAEYISAGIALYVHPINALVACRFFERAPTAKALGQGKDEIEVCTAKQLFGLVSQLVGDYETEQAKLQFEKRTGLKITESLLKGDDDKNGIRKKQ